MNPGLRKAVYGLGAAVLVLLGMLGLVTPEQGEQWLHVLETVLEFGFSLGFVLAAKHVPKSPNTEVPRERTTLR